MLVQKLNSTANLPIRKGHAAGYELASAIDTTLEKNTYQLISTGLALQLPAGVSGRIASRSSLALHHKITVEEGVIDPDYRGDVGVILYNHSNQDFEIKNGDTIAQLILVTTVTEVKSLEETSRGSAGYRSTGIETVSAPTQDLVQKANYNWILSSVVYFLFGCIAMKSALCLKK